MNFREYVNNNASDGNQGYNKYGNTTNETKANSDTYGNSQTNSSNNVDSDKIQKDIDRYSQMSQADLLQEFLRLSKANREQGKLSDDAINNISNTLAPYLTEEQKQYLNSLFDMVK